MGAKQSTSPPTRTRTFSTGDAGGSLTGTHFSIPASVAESLGLPGTSSGGEYSRSRARSLGGVPSSSNNGHSNGIGIPNTSNNGVSGGPLRGAEGHSSSNSTPEEGTRALMNTRGLAHSLPVHLLAFPGISGLKCPICSKVVLPDDIECHLVMCLTRPRISYNEDVLTDDKGECVICFEDLQQGDTIARLPCLCVYHKPCIDQWFEVNRSCPEHPID